MPQTAESVKTSNRVFTPEFTQKFHLISFETLYEGFLFEFSILAYSLLRIRDLIERLLSQGDQEK